MKLAQILWLLLAAPVAAESLIPPNFLTTQLPEHWFEQLTALDGSTQQCLVFRTIPGVFYTIEHSLTLDSWTEVTSVYGTGHEIPVAMREIVPPPPQIPGQPAPLQAPASTICLMLRRGESPDGGTFVSWRSLAGH
jgi:hypothetical protein